MFAHTRLSTKGFCLLFLPFFIFVFGGLLASTYLVYIAQRSERLFLFWRRISFVYTFPRDGRSTSCPLATTLYMNGYERLNLTTMLPRGFGEHGWMTRNLDTLLFVCAY
ncbi:hypothetical protein CC86DRAFT_134464 [Ophiobolus disseminans]|uniref:Uncharacterized protein n=1 Tax=Ophiobolus disseminans TaxID=1469910 RepID=A0A6A7AD38_9PLEO|nr:hypothetical protein CC86DRAFT_134464 [Ophiobolus disseminans]